MPRRRIAMYKIEEVLRLTYESGCSQREVGHACGLSQSAVSKVLKRAREAGLSWPLPAGLDEAAVQERLYGERAARSGRRKDAEPDFASVHSELKKHRKVTLQLLWQEYAEQHPEGCGYSHFCALCVRWRKSLEAVMRQQHRAGEKLFVDFAGDTVRVHEQSGAALEEAERPHVRRQPAAQVLPATRLDVGVRTRAQHRHEQLRLEGALRRMHRHRRPRVVHEQLLARLVVPPQHRGPRTCASARTERRSGCSCSRPRSPRGTPATASPASRAGAS